MMLFRYWRYFLRETFRNLRHFSFLTITSISTVTVVLTILSFFIIMSQNLKKLSNTLEKEITISLFLDNIPRIAIEKLINELKSWPEIKSVKFISKKDALSKIEDELMLNMKHLIAEFGENPLPDVIEIIPKAPDKIQELVNMCKKRLPQVREISYGRILVDKILRISKSIRLFATILVLLLGSASLFIIANTIRLTLFARTEEIEIMQLIGATRSFISWPYLIEGLIQGISGAIIALIISYFGYNVFIIKVSDLIPFLPVLKVSEVFMPLILKILSLGTLIGFFGSYFSIRNNLE